MGAVHELLSLNHRSDPYPIYRRLRESDPVLWSEAAQAWIVTRHADVLLALRGTEYSADWVPTTFGRVVGPSPDLLVDILSRWIVFRDPPDHTRIRGLLVGAFKPSLVDRLRPRIESIVDGLIDRFADRGEVELVSELAYPLPVLVIAQLLGVPPQDAEQLKRWSDGIARFLGGGRGAMLGAPEATKCLAELTDYFRPLLVDRRRDPQEDLVSQLARADPACGGLEDTDILATCALLLFAGHETTSNLIGNGVLALVRQPTELQRLRQRPALLATAVDEILRYDAPVQIVSRIARGDQVLGGRTVLKGQRVMAVIGSANRDDARFEAPDVLDVARESRGHLSFGAGIHGCIGGHLAELEAQIALGALLRRFARIDAASTAIDWRKSLVFRGVTRLPLKIEQANSQVGCEA